MTTPVPASPPPTPSEYFIDTPLYEEVVFSADDDAAADEIFYCKGPIDAYCPGCKAHSIFVRHANINGVRRQTDWLQSHRFDALFTCSRSYDHQLLFITRISGVKRTMQKIGQFPSLADLSMHDVKKYASILEKTTFQELTKAIGLAAHGVGVGSFVYLRRIFENLVEEAHQAAKTAAVETGPSDGWDEDAYQIARMGDKILHLKNYLPEFLVENRAIYGILSKGIHELSERECLAAFQAVKVGIEIILDAKLEEFARRKKLEEAKKSIQALASANNSRK